MNMNKDCIIQLWMQAINTDFLGEMNMMNYAKSHEDIASKFNLDKQE